MPSILDEVDKQRNRTRPRQVNRTPELDKLGRQGNYPGLVNEAPPSPTARPDRDYRKEVSNYMDRAVRAGLNAGGTKLAPDKRPVYGPPNQPVVADNRPIYGPENRSWLGRQWDYAKKVWDTATDWGSPAAGPAVAAVAPAAAQAAAAGAGARSGKSASEQALASRTAAAASPGKINYEKPFWWMDEQLGDRRPVHLIRGTKQSWFSPITGTEFASPEEAFKGVTRAEELDLRTKIAERAHEIRLENVKGGYRVSAAKAGEEVWKEMKGLSLNSEPSLYNTETGAVRPATPENISEKDKEIADAAIKRATEMYQEDEDAIIKRLADESEAQRKIDFEALSRMYPQKAKKVIERVREKEAEEGQPLFE